MRPDSTPPPPLEADSGCRSDRILYDLLTCKEQRPAKVFWLGSNRFLPERVGYETVEAEGLSKFDPALPGNSNAGHWFQDGSKGNGVVGPASPSWST